MDKKNERKRSEESIILDTSALISGKRGMTTIFSIIEFPIATEGCIILYPDTYDFERALELALLLRQKGKVIGSIDILIASMSLNRKYTLITKDSDFARVKEIIPEFSFHMIE